MKAPPIVGAERTNLAIRALALAVGLGLLGDLLVHGATYGVGFSVFTLLLVAASAWSAFANRQMVRIEKPARLLAIPIAIFGLLFAWHDSSELRLLNVLCLVLLIGLTTASAGNLSLMAGRLSDYVAVPLAQWGRYLTGFLQLAALEGGWKRLDHSTSGKTFKKVGVGIMMAIPCLLLFGALFASADVEFEKLLSFSFDFESAMIHFLYVGFYMVLAGGIFMQLLLARRESAKHTVPQAPPFGIVEIATFLVMLDLLFGAFVATQFRHFFGGSDIVRSTQNLGYAEYARRGFFELATVTLLTVPVLLGSFSLLARTSPRDEKIYSVLATILILLVFAVIHSAWLRMRLYVDAYGITALRLYVFAAIAWIGAVFACFVTTVLRGRPERFGFGAASLFVGGVLVLNVLNPDHLIASINTGRAAKTLDAQYLRGLSLDAVPALAASVDRLPVDKRKEVLDVLSFHQYELRQRDPRSWNASTGVATSILEAMKLPAYVPPTTEESNEYGEEY